ncbi:MAG: VWA domain-containing protein [Deltaproteobacteria bacterium]
MKLFDPSKFTLTTAKPLPVILLLDTSGSMSGDKITALNQAVHEMFDTFRREAQDRLIVVSVITFGGGAAIHMAPTAAAQVAWKDLQADGGTPMGEALAIAKKLIEDKEAIPSRAYRPAVVLVSDGQPTDEWQGPLNAFIKEGRSAKCDRMSMGIGSDADESVLSAFIAGTSHPLYRAANAGQIHEFFRRVTMSVSMRASSKTPNTIPSGINLIAFDGATATGKPSSPSAPPPVSASEGAYW